MLRSVLFAVALASLASGRSAATEETATVVESAPPPEAPAAIATAPAEPVEELEGIVIQGRMLTPTDQIKQRIAEAQQQLRLVPLEYTYLRRLRESLRGRPVLFAGWSEREQIWHPVEIEIDTGILSDLVLLIAITGWGKESDKAQAMEAGFNHHFNKLVDPDRITEPLHVSR